MLFDVGNVLVPFQHERVATSLADALARGGGARRERGELHRFLFDDAPSGRPSYNQLLDTGKTELDPVRLEFNRHFHAEVSLADFTAAWGGIFDAANAEISGWIARVQGLGLRVGICSDTNAAHWAVLRALCPPLDAPGVRHFLSFRSAGHFRKVDAGYFAEVAAATGQPPANHLLLDDRQVNIASAQRCGFQALLVDETISWKVVEDRIRELRWIG